MANEVKPLGLSRGTTRMPFRNFNYTNQDYWTLKERILDLIKQNFDKEFNDFMESDLAIMLAEIWAFLADTLSFKIDQIANEIFIDSVREPDNAFRLARLVGFKPTPPVPARSMFMATLNSPVNKDVVIPTPIALGIPKSEATIELFQADNNNNPIWHQPIVIPAGQTVNRSIIGIEGFTQRSNYISSGQPNQTFELGAMSILWKSAQVYVDGAPWKEVDFFTATQPLTEYRLEYTANYRAIVIFGDNKAGMIPPAGAKILVIYRVGGGSIGNVITGSVKTKTNYPVDSFNHYISINYVNYTKGEFGYDGDTIEDIRRKLPAYIRTQHRAVTGQDYKTLAEQFATPYNGRIGKATATLRNYGCAGNIIDLFVLAQDGNNLSTANANLKDSLYQELDDAKMFTDSVCIKDGKVLYVDVRIDGICDRTMKTQEEPIKERVRRRLDWFFRMSNWEFGQALKEADVIRLLADIKEVSHFEMAFTTTAGPKTNMIVPRYDEIIRPNSIDVQISYN